LSFPAVCGGCLQPFDELVFSFDDPPVSIFAGDGLTEA
jgi:hypothetical protein